MNLTTTRVIAAVTILGVIIGVTHRVMVTKRLIVSGLLQGFCRGEACCLNGCVATVSWDED